MKELIKQYLSKYREMLKAESPNTIRYSSIKERINELNNADKPKKLTEKQQSVKINRRKMAKLSRGKNKRSKK